MTNLRFNFKIDLINVDYIDFSFAEDYQDLEDNPFLIKHFPDQGEYQKETIVLSLTEEEEALFPDKYYVLAKIQFIDSGIIKAHACKMKQASVASISVGAAEQNIDLYMNEIDMGGYYDKEEIDEFLENKQDTLTAGTNIVIDENNTISAIGDISIDYDNAINKPQINNVTLLGNKSLDDLGIQPKVNLDNIPIKNKEKGISIQLNDSTDRTIDTINIIGKSTQVKTNGYQLLDRMVPGTIINSSKGVTFKILDNGMIYTYGTATSDIDFWLTSNNYLTDGTYRIKATRMSAKVNFVISGTDINKKAPFDETLTISDGNNHSVKLVIKEGTTVNDLIYRVMVEEGNVSHNYESYSGKQPSPSLDYPQEIKDTAEEKIDIKKKNLLTLDNVNKSTLFKTHATYEYNTITNEYEITCIENGIIQLGDTRGGKLNDIVYNKQTIRVNNISDFTNLYLSSKNNQFTRFTVLFFNSDRISITDSRINVTNPGSIAVPEGASFCTIVGYIENAVQDSVYKDMIMVSVDGDITYEEPINPQTATLNKPLRGIPVASNGNYTDNNNQQWLCDTIERYKDGSGKYIQRINRAEIDGSNTNYKASSNQAVGEEYQRIYINNKGLPSISNPSETYPQMSDRYQLSSNWIGEFEHAYAGVGNAMYIFDKTERVGTTVQTANDYLATNPTSLLYILATPIETPLTSEELAELNLDTYYPSTTITANTDVVVEYICDTKNYIDKKLDVIQNAIISLGGNV